MALNAAALATLIKTKTAQKLAAVQAPAPGGDAAAYAAALVAYSNAMNQATAEAIAEAVVEHITQAAQVLPGIPVATAGSPSAQTGATTGPGTIQ